MKPFLLRAIRLHLGESATRRPKARFRAERFVGALLVAVVAAACSDQKTQLAGPNERQSSASAAASRTGPSPEYMQSLVRRPAGGRKAPRMDVLPGDPTTLVESFDDPLSGWLTRFMGLNSNLKNLYVQYNSCWDPKPNPDDCRGNNLDGLWIADDNNESPNSYIRFTSEFAASLTGFALDIGNHVSDARLKIYDKDMNVLLDEAIPLGCSNCEYGNPEGENVYSHHGVTSSNGIGGFDITSRESSVEGNVGIDNIQATQGSEEETTEEVPAGEPATVTVKEDGKVVAGVDIPEDTFDEDVTVHVEFREPTPDAPCHKYLLGQTGKCLEITAKDAEGNDAKLLKDVIIGLCVPKDLEADLFKSKTDVSRPVALEEVEAPFLECNPETGSRAPRNWLEGLAMGVTKRVGRWISPKLLYASDRGFGGRVDHEDAPLDEGGLSVFTWASPIQVNHAGLSLNVFNSGKDAFVVTGVFAPRAEGEVIFDAAQIVKVGYGREEFVIPGGSFKWSSFLKRFIYVKLTQTGVNYMDIEPNTGAFHLTGRALTEGDAMPAHRPFSFQIEKGSDIRVRGALLHCSAGNPDFPKTGACVTQH
jgi:hypothetical protein